MKIHLMFYISLLQSLKEDSITREVPLLLLVIVDNGNSFYFIDLIDNI